MNHALRGKAACVGVALTGMGEAPGRSAIDLMANAVLDALEDAGIPLADVDGVFAANAVHAMASMSLSEHLGIVPVISDNSNIGGSSFMQHALLAATALEAGLINVAVIAYGSTQRSAGGFRAVSEPLPYETQFKPRNPITSYALAASHYLDRFGVTREQMAQVPVAARAWANLNPQAFMYDKGPLTIEDVVAARMISDPLGKLDCCLVTDGGAAIVMTRADRAKDTRHSPVHLLGAGVAHNHRMISAMPDFAVTSAAISGARAYEMAGLTAADMDSVQLYDAFSINTLLFLEDLGFCEKGEAVRFIANGHIAPGGGLPVNTNGGGLSCVHPGMYGLFVMIEAISQIRATLDGAPQPRDEGGWVPDTKIALAHGNGGVLSAQVTTIWCAPETV